MVTENAWKQKYFDALENTEATELRLKDAEEILRLTVSRLTLAAGGADRMLDDQFSKLRKLVKKTPKKASIHSLLEEISQSIKRLDLELQAGKTYRLPSNLILAKLLKEIEFPNSLRKKVRQLDKSLQKKESLAALDTHIDTFSKIVEETFGSIVGSPGKPESGIQTAPETNLAEIAGSTRTLLNLMLGQLRQGLGKNTAVDSLKQQIHTAITEQDLEDVAIKLSRILQTDSEISENPANRQTNSNTSAGTKSYEEVPTQARFIELINLLSLPGNLEEKTKEIRAKLDAQVPASGWPHILSDIADVVAQMRSELEDERSELQKFLLQLTTQLQNIDTSLLGAEHHHQASLTSGLELDKAVRSDLSDLKNSANDATDLESLRQTIDERMEHIHVRLHGFRESETKRLEDLSTETKKLRSRLKTLESETSILNQKLVQERKQARTDPLTGILNRMAYDQRLDEEYLRWQAGETSLSLIVCDIDRFKHLNDNLGHQVGDRALQCIATVLKSSVRKADLLARYGGEEFVVLISGKDDKTSQAVAKTTAEKIRSEVESAEFKCQGELIPITISCGISHFRSGDSIADAFGRADKCLYQAKELGRNRVVEE